MSGPESGRTLRYTRDFEAVLAEERAWLAERRRAAGVAADAPEVGLAFSGGGIRSATYNLGVLQALSRRGLLDQVDYLSSVSGGGYIASCLSWMRSRLPAGAQRDIAGVPLADGRGTVLDWLRAHGNYLINGRGFSGWTLGAAMLAGTLLNLIVLLPLLIGLVTLASLDWFGIAWPEWLHLPGATGIQGHDGFMLLLWAGPLCFLLYLAAMLLFAVASSSPVVERHLPLNAIRTLMGRLLAVGVLLLGIGLLPVSTGLEETMLHYFGHEGIATLARQATYLAPIVSGLLSLRAARAGGAVALANLGLALLVLGFLTLLYHLCAHTGLTTAWGYQLWVGLSLLLALSCDINALSLHSYYRGRLADAYLPVTAEAAATDEGRGRDPLHFRLCDIHPRHGGPLQLINTTLNTSSSRHERLRSRQGESLVLSPLYCGSSATGYRRTSDYLGGAMTLSTAFSVSGAAVDPNTFVTRSRALSFMMALLNLRLGYWARNPAAEGRGSWLPGWYRFMLREMLGVGLAETEADVHLADGGHFDNLGLYELVRRRCRFILVCDAAADPGGTLFDLGRAIQRVRADFGAEVELCADRLARSPERPLLEHAFAAGTIRYRNGSEGRILYLRAALCQNLSADIYAYWRANPGFPDQTTVDQFFDEMQFDSYRQLGLEVMSQILDPKAADFAELFAGLQSRYPHEKALDSLLAYG